MSEQVLTNAYVSLDGNDISANVKRVAISYEADDKEATAMGDDTHVFLGGLKNWSAEVELNEDYAAAGLDSILFPLVGTEVAFAVRPDAGAKSTSNPEYGGTVLVKSYPPLAGAVGDLAGATVSLMPAKTGGTLTRTTV